MKNELFEVEFHPMTGGAERLLRTGDTECFNWCRGKFGIPYGLNFLSASEITEDCVKQTFSYLSYLDLVAERHLTADGLRESYTFVNTGDTALTFKESELGIYATFADGTDIYEIALNRRAHSHIWCGGDTAYIYNIRMNGKPDGVGLVLTKGRVASFEAENATRDNRGDIALKLPPLTLESKESYTLEWLVFPYQNKNEFLDIIRREGALTPRVTGYYVKRGETLTITAEAERALLLEKEFVFSQGSAIIPIDCCGEQRIDVIYGGDKKTFIKIFAGEREDIDAAAILKRHGVKKLFSRKDSSAPLIEARKNLGWYNKIGDKGYLALAAVELFRYYRAHRAERFADICLPAEVFKQSKELIPHLEAQAAYAIEDRGIFGFYKEAAAFDVLLKAYEVTCNESYLAAARQRLERLSAFVGIQPDYKTYGVPDLYRNDIDRRIPELIDCGALLGYQATLAEYFRKQNESPE